MKQRMLGRNGPSVSALGLGCMGMSAFYGAHDDAESLRTLNHALDRGVNLLDTADMYGPYRNEELLAQLLKSRRSEVVLATKFGIVMDSVNPAARGVNGRPEYVRSSCEGSLKRLGVDVIDLYYQHRVDPEVPIEDTVGAMADLVRAGKVRYLGLSRPRPTPCAARTGPSHSCAAKRVFLVDTRPGAAGAGLVPGVGCRFRRLQPAGAWFLDRSDQEPGRFRRR